MALVVRGSSTVTVVEEFLGYKSRLDAIARELKVLMDKADDRREGLGQRVQSARDDGRALGILTGLMTSMFLGPVAGLAAGMAAGQVAMRNNEARVYELERANDRDDRDQMRVYLYEFQQKITSMRLAVKFLKKYFLLHHMPTENLEQMEQMINDVIEDIDMASSLESLQRVSAQCKRVMNRLEQTLEDVKVELYFAQRSLTN